VDCGARNQEFGLTICLGTRRARLCLLRGWVRPAIGG